MNRKVESGVQDSILTFNRSSRQYRLKRFPRKVLKAVVLEEALRDYETQQLKRVEQLCGDLATLGRGYESGQLSETTFLAGVLVWRAAMYRLLRNTQLNQVAAECGGFARMTSRDYVRASKAFALQIPELDQLAVEYVDSVGVLSG